MRVCAAVGADYLIAPDTVAGFALAGDGTSFSLANAPRRASDSALVTGSIEKRWLNGWCAAAAPEGEFSSVTASYASKGVVR